MAEYTASQVRELRELSGAGMMDCKKALEENGGDTQKALDWLRKKGVAAASKKSDRVTAEGLVAVKVEGGKGVVVEVNSETDFVAKNDKFQKLVLDIADAALANSGDLQSLKAQKYPASDKTVEEELVNAIATIGENINLRRSGALNVAEGKGVVASYVHSAVAPNLGKIGVLVALESTGNQEKLAELGKQIAMHVAAARPEALNREEVSSDSLEREKDIFREQAKASGKPAEIIEKMIEGRIRKYYEEVVLNEQLFVIDGKTRISDVVKNAEKEIGAPVKLSGFVRFGLGEGVEKKEENFAEEVAAAAKVA